MPKLQHPEPLPERRRSPPSSHCNPMLVMTSPPRRQDSCHACRPRLPLRRQYLPLGQQRKGPNPSKVLVPASLACLPEPYRVPEALLLKSLRLRQSASKVELNLRRRLFAAEDPIVILFGRQRGDASHFSVQVKFKTIPHCCGLAAKTLGSPRPTISTSPQTLLTHKPGFAAPLDKGWRVGITSRSQMPPLLASTIRMGFPRPRHIRLSAKFGCRTIQCNS